MYNVYIHKYKKGISHLYLEGEKKGVICERKQVEKWYTVE